MGAGEDTVGSSRGGGAAAGGGTQATRLSVLTFNVLAPCYKRVGPPVPREPLEASLGAPRPRRAREASDPATWLARQRACIAEIEAARADVCMLQEFQLDNADFVSLYEDAFAHTYEMFYARRPGKADGLCTMVRREALRVVGGGAHSVTLVPKGDRVATILAVQRRGDARTGTGEGGAAGAPTLLLCNTHLSFNHGKLWDRRVRQMQAAALTAALRRRDAELAAAAGGGTGVADAYVIGGDFNGDREEFVFKHMIGWGYEDAMGVTCSTDGGVVTHLTHNGDAIEADYFFVLDRGDTRGGGVTKGEPRSRAVAFASSELLPQGLSNTAWPDEHAYSMSDHRPLKAELDWLSASAPVDTDDARAGQVVPAEAAHAVF
eukprot:PRCOL_00001320-RA